MRSGHAAEFSLPVIAAGVGVRRGSGRAIRSASFRLGPPGLALAVTATAQVSLALDPATPGPGVLGPSTLGIVTLDHGQPGTGPGRHSGRYRLARQRAADEAGRTLTAALAGRIPPAYGSLIVLGEDLSTPEGRAAVRRQVGLARARSLTFPGLRVRGMVEQAAWRAGQPGPDRYLLVAAILDRLALAPWSGVPLRSAPRLVERKTRLAAAMVHEPRLLLLDGLLDDLGQADQFALSQVIADLARDTPVIAAGRDARPLLLACAEVLTLSDGILTGPSPDPASYLPWGWEPDPPVPSYLT